MEMSVREAKAKFSEILAAAARGEPVTITKFGEAFVDMVPSKRKKSKINLEAGQAYLKSINFNPEGLDLWPPEFDDPAFSRKVLGLED
jgi:antitoxin (DNA-binding transcriptional repressor) of toxin-antitoxin stability system